jgi:hypothetical protein
VKQQKTQSGEQPVNIGGLLKTDATRAGAAGYRSSIAADTIIHISGCRLLLLLCEQDVFVKTS